MRKMAKEKYYGTLLMFYIPDEVLQRYNVKRTHKQFSIVCKAKSRASADRIFQEILGVTSKVFDPAYTSETGNKEALVAADLYTSAISLDNLGKIYYDMKTIFTEVEEFRKTLK
jgi:3'-phosphoadenosine 5'-phosphosulfate sulfotransferase (PAPS reductase)/FAD synthetase